MHSENISRCQDSDELSKTEELDDSDCALKKAEISSDESRNSPSPSPKKQAVQKNLPPLKIKIPTQRNKAKAKCGEEKPACQANGKKRKKNELENEQEGETKGFHIDGDITKFLEHLDQHTRELFQNTKGILDENLPIIYYSLASVKSFISLLGKILKKIPHKIDLISGEITLKCKGCLLHCPQNWDIISLPG